MQIVVNDTTVSLEECTSALTKRVLRERGWKTTRLAQELSVHPDLVRRWVRGERRPQLDDLLSMARMVDASLDEMFGLAGGRKQQRAEEEIDRFASKVGAAMVRKFVGMLANCADGAGEVDESVQMRAPGEGPSVDSASQEISLAAQEALAELLRRTMVEPQRRRA